MFLPASWRAMLSFPSDGGVNPQSSKSSAPSQSVSVRTHPYMTKRPTNPEHVSSLTE